MDGLLTAREAAAALRVSLKTVRNEIKRGRLPVCRVTSRAVRIPAAAIMARLVPVSSGAGD